MGEVARLGTVIEAEVTDRGAAEAITGGAPDWRHWTDEPWVLFVVLGAALIILTGTIQVAQPLDRDEGAFLAIAQGILHGQVPYRDVFDHKSPGIYYTYALVLALTSHLSQLAQIVSLHLLVAVVNLLTAAGILLLGRRWKHLEMGALAASFWLIGLPLYQGVSAFTEPFAICATIWAFVVASRRPSARSSAAVGLLLAVSCFYKQTGVLAVPGAAFLLYWRLLPEGHWRPPLRAALEHAGALLAGLMVPWLLVAAAFAVAGAGGPFVADVLVANLHYPADPLIQTISGIIAAIKAFPFLWFTPVLVTVLGGWSWLRRTPNARQGLNPGLTAMGLTGALNLAPFVSHAYLHYWIQVLPWAALFCADAIMSIISRWRPAIPLTSPGLTDADRVLRRLLLPVLLGVVVATSSATSLFTTAHLDVGSAGLRSQIAAGAWIRARTASRTRLLVAPAEPEFYYLSGREPVTRYVYVLPVNRTPALESQLTAQIQDGAFDAIVWQEGPDSLSYDPADLGLYAVLTAHYHAVSQYPDQRLVLFEPNGAGR